MQFVRITISNFFSQIYPIMPARTHSKMYIYFYLSLPLVYKAEYKPMFAAIVSDEMKNSASYSKSSITVKSFLAINKICKADPLTASVKNP